MGEVTVSSEEGVVDMEVVKAVGENRGGGKRKKKKKNSTTTTTSNKDGSSSAIRWERFLPRMVIRVLLVEADDSTRQIISALLRKCSYKVAAVSDGLKAWEVLKGRPHNIDLILTEVELPSISGFALLTLINEHEICKNIPVIMMSSQDSVSTVYKCMLRGAADFLVKPIRINELRNVWQHVWRRQSLSVGGSGPQPQGESATRQKVEATAENNAAANASYHSGGSKACMRSKKGSDGDQSSCTKPDMEAESAYMKEEEDQSQPKSSKYLTFSPKLMERSNNHDSRGQNFIQQHEIVSAGEDHGKNSNKTVQQEAIRPESNGAEDANICPDVSHRENDGLANPCKEAIDLIGTFGNHVGCSHGDSTSNHVVNRQEFPHLDLSLTGFHHTAVDSPEKQTLNPSIGSAFSRYVSKNPQQLLHAPPVSVCGSRDNMMNNSSNNNMSDNVQCCKSIDKKVETASSHHGNANTVSTTRILQSDQRVEVPDSHIPQQNVFHIPVPVGGISLDGVRGISLNGLYTGGYGSFVPPDSLLRASSSSSAKQNAVNHLDPCTEMHQLGQLKAEINSNPEQQNHNPHDQRTFSSLSNSKQMTNNTPETMDERTRFSSACTDQSASSSLHNNNNGGGLSHRNSFGYGSVCSSNNINSNGAGTGIWLASESGNEDINHVVPMDANYLRSIQREAALTKFRLKRKERCFDKKVRYESRKKLAEQRPRVKGQFVRQVPPDPPPTEYSENLFS